MGYLTESELERFRSKYIVEGQCWLWQAPLDKDGYGSFYLRGANRRAHRVAWFTVNGPIPAGKVINHTCRTRNCVNPQHLNCISPLENSLRDSASLGYLNQQKTHCPQGHPYDGTERSNGKVYRICVTCRRAKQRAAKRAAYRRGKSALKV